MIKLSTLRPKKVFTHEMGVLNPDFFHFELTDALQKLKFLL